MSEISLNELAEGKLQELFDANLQSVIENIYNPNTKATLKRQITIVLTFAPDEERESIEMSVDAKSKLAPVKGASTKLIIDYDPGEHRAYAQEYNKQAIKNQMRLEFEENEKEANEKVLNFKAK